MAKRPYADLSDDELVKEEKRLAKERHDLQQEQRAVEIEKQIRTAALNMSPDAKAAIGIEVGGELAGAGEAKGSKQ